ncbi:MAG: family 20 glycosylhydrolase [Planctomycetes bacterium]|nr:family 20 glycosylhydrolase [Planctomycetota bacterium]
MSDGLENVRRLLPIDPASLRRLEGKGLPAGRPLTLVGPSETAAAWLGGLPRVAGVKAGTIGGPCDVVLAADVDAPPPPAELDAAGDEAFALRCDARGLALAAGGEAGLRYACDAARRLLSGARAALPALSLEDRPAMARRAVMIDISRSHVLKSDYIEGLIDRLAESRCNMLLVYFEERFTLRRHPKLAHPLGLTTDDMDRLGRYARARGIDLVPAMATFGHCQGYLREPSYRHLADGDQIYQFNPLHPGTRELIADLLNDWASVAHSPYVHLGFDEAPYYGNLPETRDFIAAHGIERFMADHLVFMHDLLAARGLRAMVWGDMLKLHPGILGLIPNDIIVVEWNYGPIGEKDRQAIGRLHERGFDVMVAPAASSSAQYGFPRYAQVTGNIPDYLDLGVREGVLGTIICQWEGLPRFTRLSEPGLALGCRLAWEGRDFKDPAKRRAAYERACGRPGEAVEPVFQTLSPDLLLERFGRLHRNRDEPFKRYHLDTHELFATDPLLYLRGDGASDWALRVAARYERGSDEATAVFDADTAIDRTVRFAGRSCLYLGWKRTKINAAGDAMRQARQAYVRGDRDGCIEALGAALRPLGDLKALADELDRSAMAVWSLERPLADPSFDWVHGPRYTMARRGAERLGRDIDRCIASVRAGGPFTLDGDLAAREVLCFRMHLRPPGDINILNLDIHTPDGDGWHWDRRIQAFQPAGSWYDYLWMPTGALPDRLRVVKTRTQAPWDFDDLDILLFGLRGLDEPAPADDAGRIANEEYDLVRRSGKAYVRREPAGMEALYELKES